jgi:amino acid transporter
MYILGTSAVLAYTAPANVDLAAPVPQVIHAGLGNSGVGAALTIIAVGSFNIGFLASFVIIVGMVARLPMVAGWDGLLPEWWSSLHPRFRTPSKAIVAVTAILFLIAVLSLVGAGNQEAVQATLAAGIGCICIEYLLLFGTILFGFRGQARPSWRIRVAALSAFAISLVSLAFELVPSGEVADANVFAIKVAVLIVAAEGVGAGLYWRGAKRLRAVPVSVEA